MSKIRLLVIEEHAAVRQALEIRLRTSKRVELLGACGDLLDGRRLVRLLRPDVVLLGCAGSHQTQLFRLVEAVSEMTNLGTLVLVLTSYADDVERELLLQAGATRYLLKDINTPQLINEVDQCVQRQRGSFARHAAEFSLPASPMLGTTPCLD